MKHKIYTFDRNHVRFMVMALLILGLLVGFVIGTYVTIKTVAQITAGFIDEEMIRTAIYQYKNNLGVCYPPKF